MKDERIYRAISDLKDAVVDYGVTYEENEQLRAMLSMGALFNIIESEVDELIAERDRQALQAKKLRQEWGKVFSEECDKAGVL